MKKAVLASILAILLLPALSLAQIAQSRSESVDQTSAEQTLRDDRQTELDALMVTMALQMQTIRGTRDVKDRQALMSVHRESMLEAMTLMKDMDGAYMQELMSEHMSPNNSADAVSPGARHIHRRTVPIQSRSSMSVSQRLTDIETRLDMMLVMMEFMLDEQLQK